MQTKIWSVFYDKNSIFETKVCFGYVLTRIQYYSIRSEKDHIFVGANTLLYAL